MLETERLYIIPLTARQLKLWLDDIKALENELDCKYCGEPLEGHFHDILRGQLAKTENDAENYIYHSFWFIIHKADCVVVGSCAFKDAPDENHEVEIGYGLGKEFEGMGYMTEAMRAFCKWALDQKDIVHVVAETKKDNPKSENVLKRVGFTLSKQNETNWWRLQKA
jgi:RimJ/RimL family protein N-acetyltransferase